MAASGQNVDGAGGGGGGEGADEGGGNGFHANYSSSSSSSNNSSSFESFINLELFDAAAAGDVDRLNKAVEDGAKVDFISPFKVLPRANGNPHYRSGGNSALHVACWLGHSEIVSRLLELNANTNVRNYAGAISLHLAAYNGHKLCCELLLDRGADLFARNSLGATPLHSSCLFGFVDVAELLLNRGADPNEKANAGQTALCTSLHNRDMQNKDVACLLLSRGATIFYKYTFLQQEVLEKWPTFMFILALQDLQAYNLVDIDSFIDFYEFL